MPSTFDTVASIISETCDIPRENIRPESHAINDLGIDSLDFLDIAFAIATHERTLRSAQTPWDGWNAGEANALPNVYIPVANGSQLPAFLTEGLRARPLDDPFLQMAAEYRPSDIVWWQNV